MNEIVSFTKEIDLKNNIDRIISISLEHTINYDKDSTIKGDLIVSGSYRQNQVSLIDTPFSYKIPVDIVLDSKYDLSNVSIDIDNFTYDLIDNNKLKIDVDLIIDNLELIEEIENVNDLFLETKEEEKLEVPKVHEDIKEEKKEDIVEKKEESDSLFSNISSSNETYSSYSIYIVKENDTIESIMEKYNISRTELEEYNNLNDINKGSKIIIPCSNE